MFGKTTNKKSILLLVALFMCAILVFAACNPTNKFTPVTKPESATAEGNGGIAVRYGEYVYYVNGYQGSSSASNGYNAEIRSGSVVRIKIADLEKIIKINTADATTAKKSDAIAKVVAGKPDAIKNEALKNLVQGIGGAETVVPNFYYSGNTTDTSLNGIYIFNDRIYVTTPNNELDANGNILNGQLVLASYDLGGGDVKRHFVFETNSPVLKLSQLADNGVCATFVLDGKLSTVKLGDTLVSEVTVISEEITSPKFSGDYVYFLDKDGSVCQYKIGNEQATVLVENEVEEEHEGHDHNNSYTIQSVNNDYVYYTSSQDATSKLYCATAEKSNVVVLNTLPTSFFGWKEKVVYTASVPEEVVSMYGIWLVSGDGSDRTEILDPAQNGSAITLNKLDGDVLYYTANNVSYTINLAQANAVPEAYAYGLSTSATGWSVPDVLSFDWTHGDKTEKITYVFSLSSASVSVVKFNAERKNNNIPNTTTSSAVDITLTVIETSEE